MKNRYPIILLTLVLTLAAGCANTPGQVKIPKGAAKMAVSFSWEGVQPCSHESPEIRISKVPEDAVELRVKLKDVDVPEWNQGGGRVAHDGSGVIPAGALNLGYNGPCPSRGRHKYEFSVMAVDAAGVIVGFGKERQPFPPKK